MFELVVRKRTRRRGRRAGPDVRHRVGGGIVARAHRGGLDGQARGAVRAHVDIGLQADRAAVVEVGVAVAALLFSRNASSAIGAVRRPGPGDPRMYYSPSERGRVGAVITGDHGSRRWVEVDRRINRLSRQSHEDVWHHRSGMETDWPVVRVDHWASEPAAPAGASARQAGWPRSIVVITWQLHRRRVDVGHADGQSTRLVLHRLDLDARMRVDERHQLSCGEVPGQVGLGQLDIDHAAVHGGTVTTVESTGEDWL